MLRSHVMSHVMGSVSWRDDFKLQWSIKKYDWKYTTWRPPDWKRPTMSILCSMQYEEWALHRAAESEWYNSSRLLVCCLFSFSWMCNVYGQWCSILKSNDALPIRDWVWELSNLSWSCYQAVAKILPSGRRVICQMFHIIEGTRQDNIMIRLESKRKERVIYDPEPHHHYTLVQLLRENSLEKKLIVSLCRFLKK